MSLVTAAGRSEHELLIVRRGVDGAPSVLVLGDGTLPRIQSEERRSADVAELNRAVRESLGVEVSVLRCLADEPAADGSPRRHLYLLEAHSLPRGGRWMRRDDVPSDSPAGRALEAWDRAGTSGLPDWARPGWRDEVVSWVDRQLSTRALGTVRAIEQVRVWETSQVLRLDTGQTRLYFKARPEGGGAEAPLTRHLAASQPRLMPEVIAVEPDRRWLLMCEAQGDDLMDVGDLSRWEAAAAGIARLQMDWIGRTGELTALGCPRASLADLEARIGPLLRDVKALQPMGLADALGDAQVAELQHRRAEFETMCRDLGALGVPDSIEHGDLWASNVISGESRLAFLDWEDATIGHPFISPSLLLLSLDYATALPRTPGTRERLRDAYLTPWAAGPLAGWSRTRLVDAFELAQRVAMLVYAAQFWAFLPNVTTSRELHGYLPYFLGRLLAMPADCRIGNWR